MATVKEIAAAAALGFITPSGNDFISDGDDAITENAAVTARVMQRIVWDKTGTPLTAEADLSTLTPGIYRNGGGSVATALGLPVIEVSAVIVVGMSAVAANHSALVEQWAYDGNGGVVQWQAWRNSAGVLGPWSVAPRSRLLESGESSARLSTGTFGVLWDRGVEHAPPGTTGALTETATGNSAWTQQWQSWTMGAADLLVRSQATDTPGAQYPHGVQPWQRPESPRAVEWARQELAALQASLTPPHTDGTMPSSAWSVPASTVPMVVPTPDGTGQATHPSVVDAPGGWNGHRYWMAYTPYAYADNAVEDPCLAWSDNGVAWTEVDSAFPLDDAPGNTIYNSDTHLALVDGTMYVTWRKVESNVSTTFHMRTSTTGSTWTPTETVWSAGLTAAFSQVLEKSATGWRLWFVGGSSGSRNLSWIDTTAARPTSGWGAIRSTMLPTPVGREPWHVDIRRLGSRWWGVLTDTDIGRNGINCQIRLMQSSDGITWDVAATQLVPHLGHSHDVLYKAALTVTGTTTVPTLRLWYSGLSADAGWWLYQGGIPTVHDPHAAPVTDTDWTATIAALNTAAS